MPSFRTVVAALMNFAFLFLGKIFQEQRSFSLAFRVQLQQIFAKLHYQQ